MRAVVLIFLVSLAPVASGCKWIDEMKAKAKATPRRLNDKIPDVAPDQLVNFLNDRADRLKSIEYADTRMRVSGKNLAVAANLEGSLAAAQPRYFRMVSSHRIADAKVDMGSNPQEFWVYIASPREEPTYIYASHADFETGKARMPGGIPFEPDWVMQALGMITYPSTNKYDVRINERERTYTLSWTAPSPGSGGSVIKEVVFDADAATGTRPQVKKHVIRNAKTNAVIATAEIKSAQTERVGVVKGLDLPAAVQYPTRVVLKWEEPRFEMDLNLDKGTVNVPLADDPSRRGLFARPNIKGARPIDLARYDFR